VHAGPPWRRTGFPRPAPQDLRFLRGLKTGVSAQDRPDEGEQESDHISVNAGRLRLVPPPRRPRPAITDGPFVSVAVMMARIDVLSWSAVRVFVSAVGDPCPSDQATHGGVGASSGESWRLAQARREPQGDAVSVGHARAFEVQLAVVDRRRTGGLAASGSLGDGAVHGDLVEDEVDDPVVGLQGDRLEPVEDAGSNPLVATGADRGGRTGRVGDRLVRTAEAPQLQELVEDDPVADGPAMAAERMVRDAYLPLGQCRELVPERFGQP
jgi:hypothetical protein